MDYHKLGERIARAYVQGIIGAGYARIWEARQQEIPLPRRVIADIDHKIVTLEGESKLIRFNRYRQVEDFEQGDLVDIAARPEFTFWGLVDESLEGIRMSKTK